MLRFLRTRRLSSTVPYMPRGHALNQRLQQHFFSTQKDDNLSAILYNANDLRLEQRPIPEPGVNQVLLRMDTVGICGSDVKYWTLGVIGDCVVNSPMVLGHEASGFVTRVGTGVQHLQLGDRVAIEPGVPCRSCRYCKAGCYNLCPDMHFSATPPVDGTLVRYCCHDADFCHKLPDHITMEEGAFMEPLSVALHACRRARVAPGKRVHIWGAGPIGLVTMLTAKAMGAAKLAVTDLVGSKLDVAAELGATHILQVMPGQSVRSMVGDVERMFQGEKPDITIDCTGAESSVRTGLLTTRSGGVLVLVGLGKPELTVPLIDAVLREVDIRGVFRYANCFPAAISLVATERVDIRPLITHRFKLEDAVEAFETVRSGACGAIKVMIKC